MPYRAARQFLDAERSMTLPPHDEHAGPAYRAGTLSAMAAGATPKDNLLLAALPPVEQAALRPWLETVTLAAGEQLAGTGAHVWFPEGAVVALRVDAPEGGGAIDVVTMGREGIVGALAAIGPEPVPEAAVVRISGSALRLPGSILRRLAGELPSLRPLLDRYLHALLLHVAQTTACDRAHSIEQQLATLLLRLRDQSGADQIRLTHEDLAALVGTRRRASVTEAARALRAGGAVRLSRGRAVVQDPSRLAEAACPCYEATRSRYARLLGAPGMAA
jgi:CRP-like cAMP-binding protein